MAQQYIDTAFILKKLQIERHDWLNHIQVLQGFLKLESYGEVQRYIDTITQKLLLEQAITQLGNDEWVAYILTFETRYPTVQLEIELGEPFSLARYGIHTARILPLIELLDAIAHTSIVTKKWAPSIILRMAVQDDHVHFILDYIGAQDEGEWETRWHQAEAQLCENGETIVWHTKEAHEWLLEIIMG